MKLYPLDPTSRLATNIARISRTLRLNVIVTRVKQLDGLIIVANGTPDDIALSIICYHSNGDKVVGIVKPSGTRLSVIDVLPMYSRINKIMIIMDQEDQSLDSIFEEAQRKLTSKGFRITNKIDEGRLRIYECEFGGRSIRLILVVNGLDEIQTSKHTIEDHLLKAAQIFGIEIDFNFKNSKDAWRRLKSYHEEIFRNLKERSIIDVFPQQFKGCEYLKK